MTITHRITKDRKGEFLVETFVNGTLARQTWTAGSKQDANAEARAHALALTGKCVCAFPACIEARLGRPCRSSSKEVTHG